ncbi:tRNA epoxyqueuosine(34) reductase QueG [Planctomycetota bacterium]
MDISGTIKEKAIDLGFDIVGITQAKAISKADQQAYTNWLEAGFAGELDYMHRNFDKRINPAKLLKNAKSVICVALNIKRADQKAGTVANFARYEDYHQFIKKLLFCLADFIVSAVGDKYRFKICVDSAPVAERALAVRAGIGFIGRNHMLINPKFGPEILLGEIITDLNLQPDKPIAGSCGSCNKCITACPTGALQPDSQFDARKCISYLTTEYKGRIPKELAKKFGNRVFGCDKCVQACPLQNKAPACANTDFKYSPEIANLDLQEILEMSEDKFKSKFTGTVIERLGLDRLQRNTRICLENKKN